MSMLQLDVVMALKAVLGSPPVPLHDPFLCSEDVDSVVACVNSSFVSTASRVVDEFETELTAITSSPYVVATNSGTSALHLALKSVGVEPGDQVLMPALTFAATANAALYCGATPYFVDIEAESQGLCPERLRRYFEQSTFEGSGARYDRRSGRRIGAVVCVHLFGSACWIDELLKVCADFGVPLVEDAAEALGSTYGGKSLGTFGDVGILSFNGNKLVSTGAGGAALTGSEALARRIRYLASTAREPHPYRYDHGEEAYNYRMAGINAALGLAQLRRLPNILSAKRALAARYEAAFSDSEGVSVLPDRAGGTSNRWLNTIVLHSDLRNEGDALVSYLRSRGYECRPAWTPLSSMRAFRNFPADDLSTTEACALRTICLPSGRSAVGP